MHRQVLTSHAIVGALQLRPEVLPLDVKVEEPRVIHQDAERPIGEVHGGLPQDLVQDGAVGFCREEGRETLGCCRKERERQGREEALWGKG